MSNSFAGRLVACRSLLKTIASSRRRGPYPEYPRDRPLRSSSPSATCAKGIFLANIKDAEIADIKVLYAELLGMIATNSAAKKPSGRAHQQQ